MAGPLINMLQGLRQRRMRRRSGWGGGNAPGMRNIINPLDSQDMTDRAQGVDISSAMPSTRLETTVQPSASRPDFVPIEPAAEAAVRQQLLPQANQGAAAPQQKTPFMNAVGDGGPAPVKEAQCGPGGCPTGAAQGLDPSQYNITLEPGQTLVRVGPEVSSSKATASAGPAQAPQASAAPSVAGRGVPEVPIQGWQGFLAKAAENPRAVNWGDYALVADQQASRFLDLHQNEANPTYKYKYLTMYEYWRNETANASRALMLNNALEPRQKMAAQAINRGTLQSQFQEVSDFLTTPNMEVGPEDRAAAYAQTLLSKTTGGSIPEEQLAAHPTYKKALRKAYAADIAHSAAITASANEALNPFGTAETRGAGMEASWEQANRYYGAMPLEDAIDEIESEFIPAYKRSLASLNEGRLGSDRLSAAEIQAESRRAADMLQAALYHSQNADGGEQVPQQAAPQPAPARQQAPQPARPASTGGGWRDFFFE